MRTRQGKKLIDIFRILARSISTIEEIRLKTDYSRSEIRNLLNLAEEHGHVHKHSRGRIRRPRGKPRIGEFEKETGRPPWFYRLTGKALFLMRFDPKLADQWESVMETYTRFHRPNIFDSFNDLKYAIQKHPVLGKLGKPYYFDGELQRTLLNPFLFERGLSQEEIDDLSGELAMLIRENVQPEHVKNYISTLQDSISRLEDVLAKHRLLTDKIKSTETTLQHFGC